MTRPALRQARLPAARLPGHRLAARLGLVRAALANWARPRTPSCCCVLRRRGRGAPLELGARYVATFDRSRRRALHLTYYTDGDTRRRGASLARLKALFRAHGWEQGDGRAARFPARRPGVRRPLPRAGARRPGRAPGRHRTARPRAGEVPQSLRRRGAGRVPHAAGARARRSRRGAAPGAHRPAHRDRRSRPLPAPRIAAHRRSPPVTHLHIALWGVLPYLALTVLVAGTAWRYRYDRFGFTTRSSQLHESRLLRVGGPLFHYALLLVIGGHIIGLLVPEAVTQRLHVSEEMYHASALAMGGVAGIAATAGLGILLVRRLRTPAVRRATSRSDRASIRCWSWCSSPVSRRPRPAPPTPTTTAPASRCGFAVCSSSIRTWPRWRTPLWSTNSTRCSPWRCSRRGPSAASSTPSPLRWAICCVPISSTARGPAPRRIATRPPGSPRGTSGPYRADRPAADG